MDYMNSVILPHILEALSKNPKLCDSYENLCDEIEDILISEHHNGKHDNIRKKIEKALNVGQSLGIITITDDTIRVPFNLRNKEEPRRTSRLKAIKKHLNRKSSFDNYRGRSSQKRTRNLTKHCSMKKGNAFKTFITKSKRRKTLKKPLSRSKRR